MRPALVIGGIYILGIDSCLSFDILIITQIQRKSIVEITKISAFCCKKITLNSKDNQSVCKQRA